MAEQRQDDQLEPTYSSSVPIRDIALKTYREGGKRGSGISVLIAQHDDDDDDSQRSESALFILNKSLFYYIRGCQQKMKCYELRLP